MTFVDLKSDWRKWEDPPAIKEERSYEFRKNHFLGKSLWPIQIPLNYHRFFLSALITRTIGAHRPLTLRLSAAPVARR
jgi:hypothetical protein